MDALAPLTSEPQAADLLPQRFCDWFAARGWSPRSHQLAMIGKARAGRDALLIAPTGGGKTLAGFLPSLIDLAARPPGLAHPSGQGPDLAPQPVTPADELPHNLRVAPPRRLTERIVFAVRIPVDPCAGIEQVPDGV